MTGEQYGTYLTAVAWICVAGAFFNILKIKTKGLRASLMCGAFIALGSGVLLLRSHASSVWLGIAGAATFSLLVAEALIRLHQQGPRGTR